jgi:NADH dehydrogenase
VVHVSITNPSQHSRFEYFRGKAQLEHALRESGMSYAILRPAVLFGGEDILINNIAYLLRHFPVFAIPGRGDYRLQPIHVDDLADLAVAQGRLPTNTVTDAIGPETFTFRGLVELLKEILAARCWIVGLPAPVVTVAGKLLGMVLGDVLITPEEVQGLMADLLYTDARPTGGTALTAWARQNASTLGRRYHSELARRRNREAAYENL